MSVSFLKTEIKKFLLIKVETLLKREMSIFSEFKVGMRLIIFVSIV